jgi:hypothetical protein
MYQYEESQHEDEYQASLEIFGYTTGGISIDSYSNYRSTEVEMPREEVVKLVAALQNWLNKN